MWWGTASRSNLVNDLCSRSSRQWFNARDDTETVVFPGQWDCPESVMIKVNR